MGYRLHDDGRPLRQTLVDIAEPIDLVVDNGTITRLFIPCSYVGNHVTRRDAMMQDHIGWPSPDNPDMSFQPMNGSPVEPINLSGEGYDTVEVSVKDDTDGLSFTGVVDGSVICLTIEAMCTAADSDDFETSFSAYAVGSYEDQHTGKEVRLRDVIVKGTLRIIAGTVS